MAADSLNRARTYNRIKLCLRFADIAFTFFYLLVFQLFASEVLRRASFSLSGSFYLNLAAYIAAFSVIYYLAGFPLNFYGAFILEHRFDLSGQPFKAWLIDDLKKGVLSLAVFLIFIGVFYFFLRNFQGTWWIWIAIFWFMATVLLAKITPIIIIPLFFKYLPVGDELRRSIVRLSDKCGIKLLNVYKIDFSKKTNKLNAALVGVGKGRRVLLADNLVNEFSEDQICAVLAHEFGHHRLFHIWKLMGCGFISVFLSFCALFLLLPPLARAFGGQSFFDPAIFPAMMLFLFLANFVLTPLQNAFSRKLEREADLFALRISGKKDVFISLMKKLAERNLADPDPSKLAKIFFYDHPPIAERIKFAEHFRAN
jgi:STE24 endopeptidase